MSGSDDVDIFYLPEHMGWFTYYTKRLDEAAARILGIIDDDELHSEEQVTLIRKHTKSLRENRDQFLRYVAFTFGTKVPNE